MALTQEEADKLDASDPTRQETEIGNEVLAQQTIDASTPRMIRYAVTADATGALSIPVPYGMVITDAHVECTTANVGGTLTLRSGTNAISDAMICAVDKTIVRAGTLDDAYTTLTTATSLNVIANGAADRGIITILGYPS